MTQTAKNTGTLTSSRRDEILARAADLFWEKGYNATSMSDLAAAIGVQKASLYHHVRAKEELLFELSMESMRRMVDEASSVPVAPAAEYLRSLIETHVLTLLADQSKHATALTELRSLPEQQRQHVTELRDRYDRIIEEAIRSVQSSVGLWQGHDPKVIRLALLGMLNWTVFWYRSDGGTTPEALAESFAALVFSGHGLTS